MNITVVKVGGKVVEEKDSLDQFIDNFSKIEGPKLLVHGGGRSATAVAKEMGIESTMINGRRVTDLETLKIVTMVYGGLVNKNIVAKLQSKDIDAIGLTGADFNIIKAHKRHVVDVDYGYVGDVDSVNGEKIASLIKDGAVPVIAPLTHDKAGNLLNTNADTIASSVAVALAKEKHTVRLVFCFEKPGVLMDENDDSTVISTIKPSQFSEMIEKETIFGGMIPKLQNGFDAIAEGVGSVTITDVASFSNIEKGTTLTD